MSGRAFARHVLVLALVLSTVAALAGCRVLGSKTDYADYRAVRLAQSEHARLLAMQRYAARHPDGHWSDEIRAQRSQADDATFAAGKGSRAGLEHYLAAFPDGAFAAQARSRLGAIELIEQQTRKDEARAAVLEAERKQREEELRRTWIARFASHWVRTLSGLSSWGEPVADVARDNPAFSRAFGADPRPRCSASECVKHYLGRFAIPVPGGTRVERSVSLVLRLQLGAGRLTRAELLFPERGFSRFFELENARIVVDSDADGRVAAVSWAVERLLPLLGELAGPKAVAEPDYVLAAVERVAIGPSGELTDTAAEDPSTPPNRLSAAGDAQIPEQVAGAAEQAPPDMVFAPLGVDKQGRAVPGGSSPAASPPQAQPTGEVMVMAPLEVPRADGATGAAPSSPPAPAAAPAVAPPTVRAFRLGDLRLVIFSAAGDAPSPAYDGIAIEQVSSAAPAAVAPRPRAAPKRAP